MAAVIKQDALFVAPNRRYKWLKLEVTGMVGMDEKGKRAWFVFPQFIVPIMKGNKVVREALIVTDACQMPVDPRGNFNLAIPETMAALQGLASLSNASGSTSGRDEPNWIFLGIVILCVAIGVVAIVAMVTAFF